MEPNNYGVIDVGIGVLANMDTNRGKTEWHLTYAYSFLGLRLLNSFLFVKFATSMAKIIIKFKFLYVPVGY